jgi:hypothetical protein
MESQVIIYWENYERNKWLTEKYAVPKDILYVKIILNTFWKPCVFQFSEWLWPHKYI